MTNPYLCDQDVEALAMQASGGVILLKYGRIAWANQAARQFLKQDPRGKKITAIKERLPHLLGRQIVLILQMATRSPINVGPFTMTTKDACGEADWLWTNRGPILHRQKRYHLVTFENQGSEVSLQSKRRSYIEHIRTIANKCAMGQAALELDSEVSANLKVIAEVTDPLQSSPLKDHISAMDLLRAAKKIELAGSRIKQFLTIVRLLGDPNQYAPQCKEEIDALVELTLVAFRERARRQEITIRYDHAGPDAVVAISKTMVVRCLVTLLTNAFDALSTVTGDRWIALRSIAHPSGVELICENSGPKLNPELSEAIFKPLGGAKPSGQSLGMSLYLCREELRQNQGSLFLDRAAPVTRFILSLPSPQGETMNWTLATSSQKI